MTSRGGARQRELRWPEMTHDGVRAATAFDDPAPDPPGFHRGLPSTCLTLILGTGDPFRVGGGTGGPPSVERALPSLVGGLQRAAAWTQSRGRAAGVHLSLDPLAARRVLGLPAAELAPSDHGHTTVDLEEVLPRDAARLAAQVGRASAARQTRVLRAWLADRPDPAPPRPEVSAACEQIRRHGGRIPVTDLARHVLLSPRQLRTLFRLELGVGPKHLARLARFERSVRALRRTTPSTLTAIASDCGYADLAHLDADWRELVGCPPTVWLAEERRNLQATARHTGADWGA